MEIKLNNKIVKADYLIAKRDSLTKEINRYWSIINSENVVRKGYTRNYDMKNLLHTIRRLYDEQVVIKLRLQCANMGMKLKDLSLDANVINIYKLSALKEYYVRLGMIRTIDPVKKAKKGKRALSVTEELTRNFITARKTEVKLLINTLEKKVKDFNADTDIDLSNDTSLILVA